MKHKTILIKMQWWLMKKSIMMVIIRKSIIFTRTNTQFILLSSIYSIRWNWLDSTWKKMKRYSYYMRNLFNSTTFQRGIRVIYWTREISLIKQIAYLWSKEGSLEFWVQVAGSAEGHDTLCYGWDISLLVQINCLKDIYIWHTVLFAGSLKMVDVFHEFELASSCVDLWHGTRHQLWNTFAQNDTIVQDLLKAACW